MLVLTASCLSLTLCGFASDEVAIDARLADAQSKVETASQNFARQQSLHAVGAASVTQVTQAELELAKARAAFAAISGNQADAVKQLEVAVQKHRVIYDQTRALFENGMASNYAAAEAHARLTEARLQLDVQTLILIREQQVADLIEKAQAGVLSEAQLTEAKAKLAHARQLAENLTFAQ